MKAAAAVLGAVLLALSWPAGAEAAQVWTFEGTGSARAGLPGGTLCNSFPFGLRGTLHAVLVDDPGDGFDTLAFTFAALPPASLVPCVLARAACLGTGDATAGWYGVCPEGFPYVSWELSPLGDGTYRFQSVAPLVVSGWLVDGRVAGTAAALPA